MLYKIMKMQRLFFGVALIIFGLNGFLHFLPLPKLAGFAGEFMETLRNTGYLMPTVAMIQLFAGLTLVFNRFVYLGLILMLPISFNIFAFHAFFDFAAILPATAFLVINLAQLMLRTKMGDKRIEIRNEI